MSGLGDVVNGSTITMGSFTELVDYLQSNDKPLVAIELPDRPEFIAFRLRGLKHNPNGTYKPFPDRTIFKCDLPDGFMSRNGECSYPISNYPVVISEASFDRKGVFVLDPNSKAAIYITRFMQAGRREAMSLVQQR